MKTICNILVINDSQKIIESSLKNATPKGEKIHYAITWNEAHQFIAKHEIDLLLCSFCKESIETGINFIHLFKLHHPHANVINVSRSLDSEILVPFIKAGGDDYLLLDEENREIFSKIKSLNPNLRKISKNTFKNAQPLNSIIGKSDAMREIVEKIQVIAEMDADTILIHGESGTGKELIGRHIHQCSLRFQKPFIAVNCAGIGDSLIDSELFGFERGSFTGAYNTHVGKFESASGGVLFLDEISGMPINLQGRLLRVLENREIWRIGGKKNIPIDTMFIAASNQDLPSLIESCQFREDLYFRLNMVNIFVPPLHKRKEDIPLLIQHFLRKINDKFNKTLTIEEEAIVFLQEYSFPGNVRELKNIVYNAVLFCQEDVIEIGEVCKYLNPNLKVGSKKLPNNRGADLDNDLVLKILKKNNGNISKTARQIGYSREGLSRKIKKIQNGNSMDA